MSALDWKDFQPGMLVSGEADDHFQIIEGSLAESDAVEYPFTFFGVIEQITQRRILIRGVWKWQCDETELTTEDEKRGECGVFGLIRGGVFRCSEMVPGRTWYNPLFHK